MDICIVGHRTDRRVQAFRRFAADKVRSLFIAESTDSVMPGLSESTRSIIIFDNEPQQVIASLAQLRRNTKYLSIPVVAVARQGVENERAVLLAAGASCVCEEDSPEQIWKEIQMNKSIEPVSSEYQDGVLLPFIVATKLTLKEMAGLEGEVASTYQKARHKMFGDISAVIGLTSGAEGAMVFSFEERTATELARLVLQGVDPNPGHEVVRDCIGEIANVVSGQARGLLADTPYRFHMSTPTVISGAGHEIRHKPGVPCVVAVFKTSIGEFALQLCLSSNP